MRIISTRQKRPGRCVKYRRNFPAGIAIFAIWDFPEKESFRAAAGNKAGMKLFLLHAGENIIADSGKVSAEENTGKGVA